jgi:Domain of unknown function (DUF5615)
VKWLADENFDNDVIRGILRRAPEIDIIRVQDVLEISGEDDSSMLAWATTNGRAVLTHDLSTMLPARLEHLRRASLCAPIIFVKDSLPIGAVIEDILLLEACSVESDWVPGVVYLPIR